MPAANPAEEFVDDEFPAPVRPLVLSALRRAYLNADATIERTPYLRTPGGKYERGDLIMVAASYELQLLVTNGDLPFDGEWEPFARPTGKHFVMRSRRARITTSQVSDPTKRPRKADFRDNYAEDNMEPLFDYMKPSVPVGGVRLIHILHGYQNLNFIHLTYPHPTENRHVFRSENLLRLPHEVIVDQDLPRAEGPTESPDPEMIENIQRHLRDNE